jgi:hypothetical protein
VCQVVVLGAGSDSSWFQLAHTRWPQLGAARFIELDHQEVRCVGVCAVVLPCAVCACVINPVTGVGFVVWCEALSPVAPSDVRALSSHTTAVAASAAVNRW